MKDKLMDKRICLNRNQGFTMIEVLIAMAIFSIGILGVAALQVSATNGNSSAGRVTTSITWAVDRVEELLALPYSHADLSAGEHSVSAGNLTAVTDGIDNDSDGAIDETGETGNITIEWMVTDDTPVSRTKTVQVTVTRTGPGGFKSVNINRVIPEII